MLLQWRYECRPDLGILALSGHLGAKAGSRLTGAIGWVLYRGEGPLILDLSELTGWTGLGQIAVVEAAVRLAAAGRGMEIASAPVGGAPFITDNAHTPIPIHLDLAAALAAHGAATPQPGECREWRSAGWPEAMAEV